MEGVYDSEVRVELLGSLAEKVAQFRLAERCRVEEPIRHGMRGAAAAFLGSHLIQLDEQAEAELFRAGVGGGDAVGHAGRSSRDRWVL